MKRIRSIFLLTMAALLFVLIANSESQSSTSGLFTYSLKGNGTAVITGFDWQRNGGKDVYIPRMIDGYTVTEIGAYAFSSETAGYNSNNMNVRVFRYPTGSC